MSNQNFQTQTSPCGQQESRDCLDAALEEMRFWLHIFAEHGRVIRMSLDVNDTNEPLVREAEQFAGKYKLLSGEADQTEITDYESINRLRMRAVALTNNFIPFKDRLYTGARDCRILVVVPPILYDHMRREADRFVGLLERTRGKITRSREQLGIPDGSKMAQTIPRLLYGLIPREMLETELLEEIMFFSRISKEHADYLTMTFRPEGQDAYIQAFKNFSTEFAAQIPRTQQVEGGQGNLRVLLADNLELATRFDKYLNDVYNIDINCQLPSQGANFPPSILHHMSMETGYYINLLSTGAVLLGAKG